MSIIIFSILFTACNSLPANGQDSDLKVHYIDVGQGDAILIQKDGESMLIDAGENVSGERVVNYLREEGISRLDYAIGTHPHSDHIGGLDRVIQEFDIGKVILPKVSHTSKTYEDVLKAIQEKELKITTPRVGDTYELGDAQWTILSPREEKYESLNDYSVAIRLVYKDNSFLFTGDAEVEPEREMVENSKTLPITAEVLKVGHHGSSTSTSPEFLEKVNPKVAIIQLGEDNSYGHPHRETMEKLNQKGIEVYRTDQNGTIVATGDGQEITFEVEKGFGQKETAETSQSQHYIGNKNTKVFHVEDCNQLPEEHNRVYFDTRQESIDQGYRPHKGCNP